MHMSLTQPVQLNSVNSCLAHTAPFDRKLCALNVTISVEWLVMNVVIIMTDNLMYLIYVPIALVSLLGYEMRLLTLWLQQLNLYPK